MHGHDLLQVQMRNHLHLRLNKCHLGLAQLPPRRQRTVPQR
jgi:hypothetical protein